MKDILVVLGCAPKKDGRPSGLLLSRMNTAVREFRKHNFDKVIVSGGPVKYPIPEADIMAVLLNKVVPAGKVLSERNARSTIENALFVWELIKEHPVKSVTVVTSDFHVRRVRYIFKKLYAHMGVKLRFVPARSRLGFFTSLRYFFREELAVCFLKLRGIK